MSRDHGFTLVEILVAMVLLSMIVLIGSSAYGIFAQRWDGQLGKFDVAMQNTRDLMLVQEVLDSLMPYVVYREDETPVVYFEGNRNGFVAVSSRSVFSGQLPAVVRFSVVQNEDLRFDVRYEEWFRKEATLHGNGTLTAELPEGTTHYLFNLIDENNFLVSYPELDDMNTVRKKKKKVSSYAIGVK